MKAPRKLYMVISKKAKEEEAGSGDGTWTMWDTKKAAQEETDRLNASPTSGADDWRVETYVKGD